MDKDIAIELKNVTKTFYIPENRKATVKSFVVSFLRQGNTKRFIAVNDVSVDIKKGEFIGFIGRNGSGKSTLLKLIAGIYFPDKGSRIKLNGSLVPFLELGVGFNPEISGRENVFLNGTILGMTEEYLKSRYDEIVRFAELEDFMEMPVKNYSSGMMVRLAFSIAIQTDADIYILDEILAVGDAAFQQKCIRVIQDIKKRGKTIIYVSHSMNDIKQYCDRVLLLDQGKTICLGTPDKVIDEYKRISIERSIEMMEVDKETAAEMWASRIPQTRQVEIQSMYTVDLNGKRKEKFETGENVGVCVELKRNATTSESLNLGIGLHSVDDQALISGANTMWDGVKINEDCEGMQLVILDLKLNTGTYFFSATLFKDKVDDFYHVVPIGPKFTVSNAGVRFGGRMAVEHEWIS